MQHLLLALLLTALHTAAQGAGQWPQKGNLLQRSQLLPVQRPLLMA